ncbi:MAG: outer membrane beta-barrel protein [Saprospiraceae bacterium]|nr:outer membrane beta-barrel protein [Saprospiraceae bacterium]MCB9325124.1 outer membrane beta-barrel protein [Lewinellaceae bacterium]
MNKKIFALVLPIMVLSLSTNAQVNQPSKFGFQLSYGIGSSVIQNEGINTRLGTTSVEILGTYQFKENLGISTGFSVLGLNGNSFNENGNYNQTRGILRIPVLLNTNKYLNEKTQLITSGGLFINHIIEDSYKYVNSTEDLEFENWSMGLQGRLGICHDVSSKAAVGVAYNIQYNFSDFSKNQSGIDSRMSTNTFDLFVKFKF